MLCFFKRNKSPVHGRARLVCLKHKWCHAIEPRPLASNASRLYGTTALTTSRTIRPTYSPSRTLTIAQSAKSRNLWLLSSLPTPLIPPIVFVGLLLTLWTYKCIMMVIFQNKIIYMPGVPLGARNEKIETWTGKDKVYRGQKGLGVHWREERIRVGRGVELGVCVGQVGHSESTNSRDEANMKQTVIVYFQGNTSSMPPRIPSLSEVIISAQSQTNSKGRHHEFVIVSPSYRGYWSSTGRASGGGIAADTPAVMRWVETEFGSLDSGEINVVIWGQSIGCSVAALAAQVYLEDVGRFKFRREEEEDEALPTRPHMDLKGLILETPFSTLRDMLITVYPQKWLPYRYLAPLLFYNWSTLESLHTIQSTHKGAQPRPLDVLIVQAELDELVPPELTVDVQQACSGQGFSTQTYVVKGATHVECMVRRNGRQAVSKFLSDVVVAELRR